MRCKNSSSANPSPCPQIPLAVGAIAQRVHSSNSLHAYECQPRPTPENGHSSWAPRRTSVHQLAAEFGRSASRKSLPCCTGRQLSAINEGCELEETDESIVRASARSPEGSRRYPRFTPGDGLPSWNHLHLPPGRSGRSCAPAHMGACACMARRGATPARPGSPSHSCRFADFRGALRFGAVVAWPHGGTRSKKRSQTPALRVTLTSTVLPSRSTVSFTVAPTS